MIPIHELLSRIRWDPAWAQGRFALGYYDRVARREVTVAFENIAFPPHDRFAFTVLDADDRVHVVPLHRVRAVYRDGACIWRRALT